MGTQKITIEPVTRIEGHAKVTVHLNDSGTVEHARKSLKNSIDDVICRDNLRLVVISDLLEQGARIVASCRRIARLFRHRVSHPPK